MNEVWGEMEKVFFLSLFEHLPTPYLETLHNPALPSAPDFLGLGDASRASAREDKEELSSREFEASCTAVDVLLSPQPETQGVLQQPDKFFAV